MRYPYLTKFYRSRGGLGPSILVYVHVYRDKMAEPNQSMSWYSTMSQIEVSGPVA